MGNIDLVDEVNNNNNNNNVKPQQQDEEDEDMKMLEAFASEAREAAFAFELENNGDEDLISSSD